jgi:hypothetical protein
MTLAGQISPSHGAVWSPQEVGRSESGHMLTKVVIESGEKLTYVGGRRGFMYYVVYARGRAGTRIRDRVGVAMADAKTICPYPHNAPLSYRDYNKLISKAKRKRIWESTGRETGIRWTETEAAGKGGRAFATRAHVHAREQLPPPPPVPLTPRPACHRLAGSSTQPATRPAACPSVGILSVPCSVISLPVTPIPPNCTPTSEVNSRQTRKP